MSEENRIRIAVQKSGRLNEKSLALLLKCGLSVEWAKDKLFCRCANFPLDVMLVRDDDIPEYVLDGVCDLGIVGFNVLEEKLLGRDDVGAEGVVLRKKLGFGHCRLSIAVPAAEAYEGARSLAGKRIATSYPQALRRFLNRNDIRAQIVEIGGSVEIAPALKIADAICDLVSTGTTLRSNGLREVERILESESVLVETRRPINEIKRVEIDRLLQRLEGVMKAQETKYIMMNAPREALERIAALLPGMEEPSVMPLEGSSSRIAIHAVARENIFWETMEKLKEAGASSILVLPIEKIIA